MDIKFENRIVDDFIIDEKRERAKYMLCSKKRYDFIWRISKDIIKNPYNELLTVSSWKDVAEILGFSSNEKCYVMSAFDKTIDGKIFENYTALSNVVFHGVGLIFYYEKNVLYFEGAPENSKSFRCVISNT